eukprot:1140357-Pelagomonas_calceolata.AAC.8
MILAWPEDVLRLYEQVTGRHHAPWSFGMVGYEVGRENVWCVDSMGQGAAAAAAAAPAWANM